MPAPERRPWLPWVLALLVFGEVFGLAWLRYGSLGWDMADLANMTQAVWNTTQGRVLAYSIGGVVRSRLLEHAEVLYLAFVPLFWVWPSPLVLIGGQAAVFASGVVPAYRLGERYQGQGLWAALFYALYPVAQTAVLFDVHGDPFAAAFLVWALDAWERKRDRAFVGWVLLALSAKIYVALVVLALVLLLGWRAPRSRWPALGWAVGLSVGWLLVVGWGLKMVLPTPESLSRTAYLGFRYQNAWQGIRHTVVQRVLHGLVAVLPALPWLWHPRAWPGLALVAASLAATRATYNYELHHYILPMPFFLYAFVQQAARQTRGARLGRAWTHITLVLGYLGLVLVKLYIAAPAHVPLDMRAWQRGRAVTAWGQSRVSPDGPLLVTHNLAPFFATRPWLSVDITFPTRARAQEALLDALWESKDGVFMRATPERMAALLQDRQWALVEMYDGVLYLRRVARATTEDTLGASLAVVSVPPANDATPLCPEDAPGPWDLGNGLRLRCTALEPGPPGVVQVALLWQRGPEAEVPEEVVAISIIGEWPTAGERKVHLGSWLGLPVRRWPKEPGQGVLERLQWRLHLGPGCYPVRLAWYRVGELGAYYPAHAASQRWGRAVTIAAVQLLPEGGLHITPQCPTRP